MKENPMPSIRQLSSALSIALAVLVVTGGAVVAQPVVPEYRIIHLGTFGSPDSVTYSAAYGLNERGDVTGTANDDDYGSHAFLFHHGELIDLGSFNLEYLRSTGQAVNVHGQVAGRSMGWSPYWKFPTWVYRPFVGTPDGSLMDPASGIGIDGEAFGINDSGQMAVTLTRVPEYRTLTRAHLWDPETGLREIEFPAQLVGDDFESTAWAIDQRGRVGGAFVGEELVLHAYVWDPETNEVVDLHFPQTAGSGVNALNNLGDAAGWYQDSLGLDHAVVWTRDGLLVRIRPTLHPALKSGTAEEINNLGDVVGWDGDPFQQVAPLAWVAFDAVDEYPEQIALNDLLNEADRAEWELWYAFGINDARQIVGYGFHDGLIRGFLLTPECVDMEPPVVEILDPFEAPDHPIVVPSDLEFDLLFESSDEYYGAIEHEVVLMDGCPVYDGNTYGNGDGLLSDEELEISREELCRIVTECGFERLHNPEIRVEVTDCGGSVASDTMTLRVNAIVMDTDGDGIGDACAPGGRHSLTNDRRFHRR